MATPVQSPKTPQTANTPTEMPPLKRDRDRTMRCLFFGELKPENPNKHLVKIGLPLGNICGCTMIPNGSDPIRNDVLSKFLETTSPVSPTNYNPGLVLEESTDDESTDEDEHPKRAHVNNGTNSANHSCKC